MTIAVIGAGASGMAAAIQAAWNGAEVTLFERNETVGRKLLVTGSGRCNITNDAAVAEAYSCADTQWMTDLLTCFGVQHLIAMLAEMGILVRKTSDGWYYPLSDSAHTVVDAFSSSLDIAGVNLCSPAQVISIQTGGKGFIVRYKQDGKDEERSFEKVIVSAGGKAYPSLGSRGELFPMLERLGHTVLHVRPALAPILTDLGNLKPLRGIRLDVGTVLWNGSQCLASSKGNIIFTEWGLNGPAVMNISHQVSTHPNNALEISLDLLSFFPEEYDRLLSQKRDSSMPLRVFLEAFFPPKAALTFIKNARLVEDVLLNKVSTSTLDRLTAGLRDTRLKVKGVRDFDYCQITTGGVPVTEVNPLTLESRLVNGLYLTGETLDVVGPCGGYNLQYAFSSGALAGRAAAGNQAS
jgi:predicted Rossmann fold flavoprotein